LRQVCGCQKFSRGAFKADSRSARATTTAPSWRAVGTCRPAAHCVPRVRPPRRAALQPGARSFGSLVVAFPRASLRGVAASRIWSEQGGKRLMNRPNLNKKPHGTHALGFVYDRFWPSTVLGLCTNPYRVRFSSAKSNNGNRFVRVITVVTSCF